MGDALANQNEPSAPDQAWFAQAKNDKYENIQKASCIFEVNDNYDNKNIFFAIKTNKRI